MFFETYATLKLSVLTLHKVLFTKSMQSRPAFAGTKPSEVGKAQMHESIMHNSDLAVRDWQ